MKSARMKIPFDPARVPFFYGYMIFFCSAAGMVMSGPGQTIGVTAFTDYLIENLHISRFQLSLAYMVGTVVSALLIGRAGKLLDYHSVRLVTSVAVAGLGGFLCYMAYSDYIASFFGGGVVAAIVVVTVGFWGLRFCGQGILSLSSRTMLMKWFDKKRGRVNSLLGVSIVVTFSLMPKVYHMLMGFGGWRVAWVILGCFSLLYIFFILLFYRDNPEACGLVPDGGVDVEEEKEEEELHIQKEEEWEYKDVLRNYTFWIFNLSYALYSMVVTAVTFHVVSIFKTAGRSEEEAFSIFLPIAVIGVVFNLLTGFVSDRPRVKHRLHFFLLGMLVGLILVSMGVLLLGNSSLGYYLLILGQGMSAGFFGATSSLIWPRYFGRTHLGQVSGYSMAYMIFFSAIGPSIYGWSFEFFGGYSAASKIVMVVLILLAVGSVRAVFPHKKKN